MPILTIGTVVRFNTKRRGILGTITSIIVCDDHLEYAISGCAWYTEDDFSWVSDPTPKSMQDVYRIMCEEE